MPFGRMLPVRMQPGGTMRQDAMVLTFDWYEPQVLVPKPLGAFRFSDLVLQVSSRVLKPEGLAHPLPVV